MKKLLFSIQIILFISIATFAQSNTKIWDKLEIDFTSSKSYQNPIYEVKEFNVEFTSPTGRKRTVYGFWDGERNWKVRFMPDEMGNWTWKSTCSDKENSGLHHKEGAYQCTANDSGQLLYKHGAINHVKGQYHLSYNDGTPYFWVGCTAWNGALKSTDEEWSTYLKHRQSHNYNLIQLVTTQWRAADANAEGLVAFEGSGEISINPEFFKRMDKKIDKVNSYGLVASPVILWALPFSSGRYLSPGYYLPIDEAVILSKYIVARYQGNHVIWTLGGDGKYYDELEDRWKAIGRQVFEGIDHAPVTLHPHGSSYVGRIYADENWYDIMSYQSSHSNGEKVVNWINKGPMSQEWDKLRPMPYINSEPNYEEINFKIDAEDVRNASWWSIFATPIAGITYGANGIWPWLREGESILNHGNSSGTSTWRESIDFPGSIQIGYLSDFVHKINWWEYFPARELLTSQPGDEAYNAFVCVVATEDKRSILAYIPKKCSIGLRNLLGMDYTAQWYNPQTNEYKKAKISMDGNVLKIDQTADADMVLILNKE